MSDAPAANLEKPPAEPFALFATWLADAEACEEIKYATAMCLSTVDEDGLPDGRTLLVEAWDEEGFVFFTDAESVKGHQLARLPEAALTFYWGPLDRQIRVRGSVEQAADEVADMIFERRPPHSRLTAWASRQSQHLNSKDELADRVAQFGERFAPDPVPRPPYWLAYRLVPRSMEFWQAGAGRLHDRLLYTRDGAWSTRRLQP